MGTVKTNWPKVGIDQMPDGRFRAYFRGAPGAATVTSCYCLNRSDLVQWVRNICRDHGAEVPEEFAPVPAYIVEALEIALREIVGSRIVRGVKTGEEVGPSKAENMARAALAKARGEVAG